MHIPSNDSAAQLLEGLDTERKNFAGSLSVRFGTLSSAQLADEKHLKQVFMLELQARCSPESAARIAYTSESMLIPLAVALVRMRVEQEALGRKLRKQKRIVLILAFTLSVLAITLIVWKLAANSSSVGPPASAPGSNSQSAPTRTPPSTSPN